MAPDQVAHVFGEPRNENANVLAIFERTARSGRVEQIRVEGDRRFLATHVVALHVESDAKQPASKRTSRIVVAARAMNQNERALHEVVRVFLDPKAACEVAAQRFDMAKVERFERGLVAPLVAPHQRFVRRGAHRFSPKKAVSSAAVDASNLTKSRPVVTIGRVSA